MDQIKLLYVKTQDDCINWTSKFADYFLGDSFFENPNYSYIFGKKSLETVPFIKTIYEKYSYKCLILSRNFSFPKLISNISLNNPDQIYWVLGGKRVFSLFDKLASEILCINILVNALNQYDSLYYSLPSEHFELSKIAQKSMEVQKRKITFEITTYKSKISEFSGFYSQEMEYLKLANKFSPDNLLIFSEKISINLTNDNFPIITTREIETESFIKSAKILYDKTNHLIQNFNCIIKNESHTIQMFLNKSNQLSIQVYIIECNYYTELPNFISLYALYIILLCQKLKSIQPHMIHLVTGRLTVTSDNLDMVKMQVKRCPLPFPVLKMIISREKNSFNEFINIDCLVSNEKSNEKSDEKENAENNEEKTDQAAQAKNASNTKPEFDYDKIKIKFENYYHWPDIKLK